MSALRKFISGLLVLFVAAGLAARARGAGLAERVVILANSDDRDSVRIAQHYAEVRGVPAENIIALPMADVETISWQEFIHSIWEPLQSELVQKKWIDAIRMDLTDNLGRTKYAFSSHRISYLVVCRGVPLRIMHDPELYAATPPFTNLAIFRTNSGAVDAELSLLPHPNYPINAFVPNPLYRNDHPSESESFQVVKVSRLDGPTADEALALVDRAVAAERTGLLGRAYVDIGGKDPEGDRWLESTAKELDELNFDTDVDRAPATMPGSARFDAPVLYFGWYAGSANGPFTLPGFQFPPGAIALHIHSYSAATLRSAEQNWCGPLIARGVTATVGNVFEPYLQFTHRPDLLLRALARGDTFGDAAYYAEPVLSWQAIAIGDPLYRPFAVTLAQQWENRAKLPARLAGYAIVRRMLELEAAHQPEDALALARKAQRETPSFAVGLALAERLQAEGEAKGAAAAVGFVPLLGSYPTEEWAMAHRSAALLAGGGKPAAAVETCRNLFQNPTLPRDLKLAWLPEAIDYAVAAKDTGQAESWRHEWSEIDQEKLRAKN